MKFILTIEEDKRHYLKDIVKALKKMGGKIETIIKFSGIIIGSTRNNVEDIKKINGVKSIEIDQKVSI